MSQNNISIEELKVFKWDGDISELLIFLKSTDVPIYSVTTSVEHNFETEENTCKVTISMKGSILDFLVVYDGDLIIVKDNKILGTIFSGHIAKAILDLGSFIEESPELSEGSFKENV